MKTIKINGINMIVKTIKYYAVNGNPNHKVWGASKKEAASMAPVGARLVFIQSERVLIEDNE